MLLNRVILKYCTEEAGKEAFACARTPRLRLRLRDLLQRLHLKIITFTYYFRCPREYQLCIVCTQIV